jgi:hypothetical protein
VAEAAAQASELDLARAPDDPAFQVVSELLVHLPLLARAPGFDDALEDLGLSAGALASVTGFLAELSSAIDRKVFELGRTSDPGELARSALLETLSVQLRDKLPTLFEPSPQDIRLALASFSSGQNFARLARDFFSRLSYKPLDYFLSRELANHTGGDRRFATDADRVAFERALSQHVHEASLIVEEFAGGWYGKTIWQEQNLTQDSIDAFTRYAFKKMRSELGRRRNPV